MIVPELVGMLEELRRERGVRAVKDVLELYRIFKKGGGTVTRRTLAIQSHVRGREFAEALDWMEAQGMVSTWRAPCTIPNRARAMYHKIRA